ncbi:hypothetical protein K503DRAFT_805675 [Rhizopogon vinicolor AM-OR11-026]|uniref:Uncharacterized protein n=1 Tax=Rhizopogon vinicolor AM-OR11-026 TaxID=1314800 RepID=A0A1B7MH29_9AGAM|nr:hypothetical protein K503DRAFT_805675 [Rhizopogon vinicolor AM-OR11-026]
MMARDLRPTLARPASVLVDVSAQVRLHLADASVWISTAMSLAVFNISKVVENGIEITPELDCTSGLISHPKLYKCSIKPRSAKAVTLIQQDVNY